MSPPDMLPPWVGSDREQAPLVRGRRSLAAPHSLTGPSWRCCWVTLCLSGPLLTPVLVVLRLWGAHCPDGCLWGPHASFLGTVSINEIDPPPAKWALPPKLLAWGVDSLASLILKPLSRSRGGLPREAGVGAGEGHSRQRRAAQPAEAGEPPAGAQVSVPCSRHLRARAGGQAGAALH